LFALVFALTNYQALRAHWSTLVASVIVIVMTVIPRRRWLRFFLLLTLPLVILTTCLWLKLNEPGTLTRRNFNRVHQRMQIDEVLGLLGPPTSTTDWMPGMWVGVVPELYYRWESCGGDALIVTEKGGLVVSAAYFERPPIERLRYLWSQVFDWSPPF
jgi:hypothetical protein